MGSYDQIKQQLIALKNDYTRRIDAIQIDTQHKNDPVEKDFAEQATQSENDEVLVALDNEAQQMIFQIDAALTSIEEGRYGICSKCSEKIPLARLNAAPFSNMCIRCAERQ